MGSLLFSGHELINKSKAGTKIIACIEVILLIIQIICIIVYAARGGTFNSQMIAPIFTFVVFILIVGLLLYGMK